MKRHSDLAGFIHYEAEDDVVICLKKDKNGDFKLEYAGLRSEGKATSLIP